MERWKKALETFLKPWKKREEVIGALVCGSYVTGNPSRHSDIDLHIILKEGTTWRERGDKYVHGILVSYFANPAKKHSEYAEEDYKRRRKVNAHMFSTGKILFDKTGELKKLVRDSRKDLLKKYPAQDTISVEIAKYNLWDSYDNLEEVFDARSPDFFFVYYAFLNDLFETYAKFLRFDSVPASKLRRFLINEKDKKKYCVEDFPDQEFVRMFVVALVIKPKQKMMSECKKLTDHVFVKMGGFTVDGWKIRSKAFD